MVLTRLLPSPLSFAAASPFCDDRDFFVAAFAGREEDAPPDRPDVERAARVDGEPAPPFPAAALRFPLRVALVSSLSDLLVVAIRLSIDWGTHLTYPRSEGR